MGSVAENVNPEVEVKKKPSSSAFGRVMKYSGVRLISLFITVIIGIYLTLSLIHI